MRQATNLEEWRGTPSAISGCREGMLACRHSFVAPETIYTFSEVSGCN